jgi:membrane protease YdiL (CAAX protease family)
MSEGNAVEKKSLFKTIHNDGFTWHDSFFVIFLLFIALMVLMSFVATPVEYLVMKLFPTAKEDGFWSLFMMYASTIFQWLVFAGYCAATKLNRPILRALTPEAKGNTLKMLLIGLLIGFGENALGVLFAALHSDIHLTYSGFPIIRLIAMFIVVFIQSSSEELMCRNFLYQRLRRGYRSPWVAIIGNALIFMALHLLNPGISVIPIVHLVVIAVFYSCFVYYFDSIWIPMMAHTGWNYTQNIIFGLPNSGIVSSFSIAKLEASVGQITFFYDPTFGVEGSAFLLIVTIVATAVVIVIGEKRGARSLNVWKKQEEIAQLTV